ncbi:hypothetical protein B0H14DRAFT_3056600 [Mycena olivaceomarginata]|nr:hypothetical protein B0H14DRAFT_3056600 [Mycena olivaceomarginata]
MIVILAEFFVGALPLVLANQSKPTSHWIGLILIPLISTFAHSCSNYSMMGQSSIQHLPGQDIFEAAINAREGRTETCVQMTTGASIHLVHFVLPSLVLLAWMLDKVGMSIP